MATRKQSTPVVKDKRATWPKGIASNQTRWIVRFGKSTSTYYTLHHAEQFVRALTLNGTACRMVEMLPGELTIEEALQKYACPECNAPTADECICDDLNFAQD